MAEEKPTDVKSQQTLTPEEQDKMFKSRPTPTQEEQDKHRRGEIKTAIGFKHEPDGSPEIPTHHASGPGVRAEPPPPPETPVPTQAELDMIVSGHGQPAGYTMGSSEQPKPEEKKHRSVEDKEKDEKQRSLEADKEKEGYKTRSSQASHTRQKKEGE